MDDIVAEMRKWMEEGRVAWKRTAVARPEEEPRIREMLEPIPQIRILARSIVPPGIVYIINDEAMNELNNRTFVGFDFSIVADSMTDDHRAWMIETYARTMITDWSKEIIGKNAFKITGV